MQPNSPAVKLYPETAVLDSLPIMQSSILSLMNFKGAGSRSFILKFSEHRPNLAYQGGFLGYGPAHSRRLHTSKLMRPAEMKEHIRQTLGSYNQLQVDGDLSISSLVDFSNKF